MEVDIPLSILSLQLEQAFVGCPLSFVRESLVSLDKRLTRQKEPRVNGREGILKVEGWGGALSWLDGRRERISRRPQGAFVAGGARRRRLSGSRPQAA